MKTKYTTKRGSPYPLGASTLEEGINFAFHSIQNNHVSLSFYASGEEEPFAQIPLNPELNRTGTVWHITIVGLPPLFDYGIEINNQLLVDPYATALNSHHEWGNRFYSTRTALAHYHEDSPFNWEGIFSPRIPFCDLIIYEMHVRGFTQDHSSHVNNPGTFKGMIEKIPYLKELGINAVEVLPICEFDECENFQGNDKNFFNYWGYSTINFFSLMNRFGTSSNQQETIREFKTLVRELHRNGIEIILDMVYNHTSEGDEKKKTRSFRGFDEKGYYILGANNEYYNYSGCGNTFNCNTPIASGLIIDSLKYFVVEMHIDGFRFDLASILTRNPEGIPLENPPLIEKISNDPILANTKLIAEAWDAGGLYQVGTFPAYGRWAEWNGKYRDTVRCFIKGSDDQAGAFANALSGSKDLYGGERKPYHSINFVTAHDGFSLQDLVSYNEKHNLTNHEENRDGTDANDSWNCGEEGVSENIKIIQFRERQKKNFITALMVSLGTPMLLMGDEYGHTKEGNNNTWCHDTSINWFQWNNLDRGKNFFRFCKLLILFREKNSLLRRSEFLEPKDVDWHGHKPFDPDWSFHSRFVGYTLKNPLEEESLYIAFNAAPTRPSIQLPPLTDRHKKWHRFVDTGLDPPLDVMETVCELSHPTYKMEAYSSIIFIAQ